MSGGSMSPGEQDELDSLRDRNRERGGAGQVGLVATYLHRFGREFAAGRCIDQGGDLVCIRADRHRGDSAVGECTSSQPRLQRTRQGQDSSGVAATSLVSSAALPSS